jgi:hypothetical protein
MDVVYVFKFLSFDIVSNFDLRISNFSFSDIYIIIYLVVHMR